MKYRAFIEYYFLIDEPKTGQLVPFKFNDTQIAYYEELKQLGIEDKGLTAPIREFILKARREGFSSLILGIFAADDILQTNPTESQVVSYKDDATATFRKRYRRYVLSWYARKAGTTVQEIQADTNILERYAKQCFATDASDLVIRHNQAHFYCGTAAARTGGRGGVLQKLLFSEAAHYQDTEVMTAKEIVEGTAQQVDKASGWIFIESTANGKGNYFHQLYELIKQGLSRYLLRFYGWRSFYSPEQFAVIASEFVDADMLKQEYPETEEEAFLSSGLSYLTKLQLTAMVGVEANRRLELHLEIGGVNYIDQAETLKDFALTFEKLHPHKEIYLGLDTAKDTDKTILTILLGTVLTSSGGIKGIAIDSTGQGDFMPDWFERNTRWYIHRVKFSRPSKSIMYKNLQTVIQKRLTSLPAFLLDQVAQGPIEFLTPEWGNWYRQMLNLQKEVIGNMLVIAHPPGKCKSGGHDYDNCVCHDDYPDSWALAEILYVTLNGLPKDDKPPETGGNLDSELARMLESKGGSRGKGIEKYD